MKTSNRWLYIFGGIIALVAIITVVLALTIGTPRQETLLAADTPQGTVQRFLLAVRDGDYLEAETYLSSNQTQDVKGSLDIIRNRPTVTRENPGWKVTLGDTIEKENEATVVVNVDIFRPRGPFESSVDTMQVTFFLQKESGVWKITSPLSLWWIY